MPRLSIDITTQEHQRLKAVAALNGQSIKDFVLSRTLKDVPDPVDMNEEQAMQALRDFLAIRMQQAHDGKTVAADFSTIREKAMKRAEDVNV